MRCHYEVLNVTSDADDAVLKTAYRKAALQWHPDKNQHRLEEADIKFKELQNAYEVLSDKHERAWYDSHRDAILRSGETHQAGGDGGVTPGQRPGDDIDPFQYFSTACYNGYNDGAKGFYTVYSTVFQKLAEEERQAAASQSHADEILFSAFPPFGSSDHPGSEVAAFYSAWLNFSTVKDFAWADKYNPASAPNRKVRRLMEEENKKERKGVKRIHNDAVRELVAFVRKRDKRMAAHQSSEAKKRMQREEEDRQRREQERQERLQRALEVEEAEWIHQAPQEGSEEEEELGSIPDDIYCPVCDKAFKTQNALVNHERSKQHQKAVEDLRAELEEEEVAVDGNGLQAGAGQSDGQVQAANDDTIDDEEDIGSSAPVGKLPGKKKTKKQKKKQKQQQAQVAAAFNDNDNEADIREQTSVSQAAGSDSEEVDEYAVLEHTLQAATGPIAPSKKSKKQKKKQKQQQAQMAAAADFASSDGEPELEQAAVADSEDEDAVLDRMLQAAQGNQSTVQPQLQKPKAQKKKQKQQQAQIAAADALGNSEGEPDTSQQAADTDSGFEDALLSPRAQASEFVQAAEPSHAQQSLSNAEEDEHGLLQQQQPLQQTQAQQQSKAEPVQQKALSHQQVKRLKRQQAKGQAIKPAKLQPNTTAPSALCATCGMECGSRNKLFAHLKSTGHAAFK